MKSDRNVAEIGVLSTAVHLDLARVMHEMSAIHPDWKAQNFADDLGVSLSDFQNMFWCRNIPQTFSDHTASRLKELTGKTTDELFPKILRRKNYAQMFVRREQLKQRAEALRSFSDRPSEHGSPEDLVAYGELWGAVYSVLTSSLPKILDQTVMKLLWLPENQMTHDKVALICGLTENQIRMIEKRNLPTLVEDPSVMACLATM